MPRKSAYTQARDKLTSELDKLSHEKAKTVEEAIANDLRICNAFGMRPSDPAKFDYCPIHPTSVRYAGRCSKNHEEIEAEGETN